MPPEALPDAARPRELRGLATALYVLLSAQAVACAVKIAITFRLYVLVERVRTEEDVSGFDIESAVDFADYVNWLQAVLFVGTAVTWIRWLLRARANVDAWGVTNQRFGPGWVVGG